MSDIRMQIAAKAQEVNDPIRRAEKAIAEWDRMHFPGFVPTVAISMRQLLPELVEEIQKLEDERDQLAEAIAAVREWCKTTSEGAGSTSYAISSAYSVKTILDRHEVR